MNSLLQTPSRQGLIQQWLQSQNLELTQEGASQAHANARWTIAFDQVRVHLMELNSQHVLVQARVTDIPSQANESEKLLIRAMQTASARMNMTDVGLSADADGTALWLQVQVPTHSPVHHLNQAVQRLVNEVELWRHAL
jgi:hypothetical protein